MTLKVGIFGSGQLGRMLAIAGAQMGMKISLFHDEENPCCATVGEYVRGNLLSEDDVTNFAKGKDRLTIEFENIPRSTLEFAARAGIMYPDREAIYTSQDRLLEKTLAKELGFEVPEYRIIASFDELVSAFESLGSKAAMLKTRSFGYDGKGQYKVETLGDLPAAWDHVGKKESLLEEYFRFDREISIIAVRSELKETRFYDIAENTHQNGILVKSVIRPGENVLIQGLAEQVAGNFLERLKYVGVIAIELFERDSKLYLNEIAPRVHNTGHWTIDGAETSQFENHLRAICGLPLGSTAARGPVTMTNILGTVPDLKGVLAQPNAHLHLYGKEPRPGRKIGHVTILEH